MEFSQGVLRNPLASSQQPMKEEGASWDAVLFPPDALKAANIFAAHSVEVSEWCGIFAGCFAASTSIIRAAHEGGRGVLGRRIASTASVEECQHLCCVSSRSFRMVW